MSNVMDLKGIKDSSEFILKDKITGKIELFADYCNETSFDFKSDAVYATKRSKKDIRWDKPMEGTMKCTAEVFDLKWLGILLGGEFKIGGVNKTSREASTVSECKITLSEEPKKGTLQVFVLNDDYTTHQDDRPLKVASDSDPKVGEYKIEGKEITVDKSLEGKGLAAFYVPNSLPTGQTLSINAFPKVKNYIIEGYGFVRNEKSEDNILHYMVYNAKPKPEIKLELSDNVTKLEIVFDLFAEKSKDDSIADFSVVD